MRAIDVSVSRINTFHRCRRKFKYAYIDKLVPRAKDVKMAKGSLLHKCLEIHYRAMKEGTVGDWSVALRDAEAELKSKLSLEEMAPYMTMISDCYAIMRNYVSATVQQDKHNWKEIVDVEREFSVKLPNGHTYNGIIDLVVRDEKGLWVIDHKTVKSIPDDQVRMTDYQTTLYAWVAEQLYGEKPMGIGFNYLRSSPAKIPELTQKGTMSKAAIDTDWPTYRAALLKAGLNPDDYVDMRQKLDGKRFFWRVYLPRTDAMTREVLREAAGSAQMIAQYLNAKDPTTMYYPRNLSRDCAWDCPYNNLCQAELHGVNTEYILTNQFEIDTNTSEEDSEDE